LHLYYVKYTMHHYHLAHYLSSGSLPKSQKHAIVRLLINKNVTCSSSVSSLHGLLRTLTHTHCSPYVSTPIVISTWLRQPQPAYTMISSMSLIPTILQHSRYLMLVVLSIQWTITFCYRSRSRDSASLASYNDSSKLPVLSSRPFANFHSEWKQCNQNHLPCEVPCNRVSHVSAFGPQNSSHTLKVSYQFSNVIV